MTYSQFHLGTLWLIATRGSQPLRKGEVARLVKHGLIVPGIRGQFGQTFYTLTEAGKQFASTVSLAGGRFHTTPSNGA